MFTITYKRSQLIRLAALVIAIAAVSLAAIKVYYSYSKLHNYSMASAAMNDDNIIAAEAYYAQAADNGWIDYHQDEIAEAVLKLQPVTRIKTELSDILEQSASGDPADLAGSFVNYRNVKKAAASKGKDYQALFLDVSNHFEIERHFEDSFAKYIAGLQKQMQAEMKKKLFTDEPTASFLSIPVQFFGSSEKKQAELALQLTSYDEAKIDAFARDKKFAEVLEEGIRLNKLYTGRKVNPDWLISKLETYAIAHLTASIDNNQIDTFLRDAIQYEKKSVLAYKGSKVTNFISKQHKDLLRQAERLVQNKKYADAIALYKQLGIYRNTDKQLRNVEYKQASGDPGYLLSKVAPDRKFANITNGKDLMGASLYAIGTSNGKLLLARMMTDMSTNKKEVALDKDLNIKSIKVTNSLTSKPTILIEAGSSARKSRYIVYDTQSSELKKILDIEADGFNVEKAGKIIVKNGIGEGAGQESFYTLRNGTYKYDGIKPDYVEIALASLNKYKNVKVKFTCTILAADGTTAVVANGDQYILLYGVANMHEGQATVTGTWVGNEQIKKGEQSITAYKVKVASISQ
ncbi:hypothetical protein J4772_03765 [Cohnella sp. LGH]|uniref:hypothetical protein n=1 Tax=Cohnella sp. LGH TaxID=1619153 RepID=UPI001ADC67A7|nr:hypothetical protein [Cohnella sp. LGH]QTH43569.1 hypothetical protein J4772_03765 [Cohnella sp. LGH]